MTDTTPEVVTLSERQYEVFQLIVAGLSNREIANQLYVSEQTVKNHVTQIAQRFGLTNRVSHSLRTRLVRLAERVEVKVVSYQGRCRPPDVVPPGTIIRVDYSGVINLRQEPADAGIERCVAAFRAELERQVKGRAA